MSESFPPPSKRPQTKKRGMKIRQYATRLIHPRNQHPGQPNLRSELDGPCTQVLDVFTDLQVLHAALSGMDEILVDICPPTLQPYSCRRQEIEELQHTLVRPAETVEKRLKVLANQVQNLQLPAKDHEPALVHEILLLGQAIEQFKDYNVRKILGPYMSSQFYLSINRQDGAHTEDRPDVLRGLSPQKLRMGVTDRRRAYDLIVEEHEKNYEPEAIDDHPFARPINDLELEEMEFWLAATTLQEEVYRFGLRAGSRHMLSMSKLALEAHNNLADELLVKARALRVQDQTYMDRREQLRRDYEAGPRTVQLDRVMAYLCIYSFGHIEGQSQNLLGRCEEFVAEGTKDLTEDERKYEEKINMRRLEVTILSKYKMTIFRNDTFFASLKNADFECKAAARCQEHHFWYKGLHPMSDYFHQVSHDVSDYAAYTKTCAHKPVAFFGGCPMGLKSFIRKTAKFEESFLKQVEVYDSLPELTFPMLDDEVFKLATEVVQLRKTTLQLFVKLGGIATEDSDTVRE